MSSDERAQIARAMRELKPNALQCYAQHKVAGIADLAIVLDGRGHVDQVTVRGDFAATPTGECIQSVVREARLPGLGRVIHFTWPYVLR